MEPEEKVILVFFLVPILSSQTHKLMKKYQKKPEKKKQSQRHVKLGSLFEFNKYDYIFVIIINTLFYIDLEITSKIM